MKKFLKLSTLLLCEITAFFSAILLTESVKIFLGKPYQNPLWCIEIPLYYQTPELYSWYCGGWGLTFLLLSGLGITGALRNQRILMLVSVTLLLVALLAFVALNARTTLF